MRTLQHSMPDDTNIQSIDAHPSVVACRLRGESSGAAAAAQHTANAFVREQACDLSWHTQHAPVHSGECMRFPC